MSKADPGAPGAPTVPAPASAAVEQSYRSSDAAAPERLYAWERLMALAEVFERAAGRPEVLQILRAQAGELAPSYAATVVDVEADAAPDDVVRGRLGRPAAGARPGLWRADAAAEPGAGGEPWATLGGAFGVPWLAFFPVGTEAWLLLAPRAAQQEVPTVEEWYMLLSLIHRARAALAESALRLHHRHELVDELTGLPNRRQMRVVLDRYLAAARRGEPLALVLIGLEGVEGGVASAGLAGEALLREAAQRLNQSIRGTDLSVRYGRDQLAALLPRCSAAGAQCVVHRVRQRFAQEIPFTAGIAEFGPQATTAEELRHLAEQALERVRQRYPAPPAPN